MLSAAKHLSADRDRPFAALRVTRCDCSNCHVLFFKLNLALTYYSGYVVGVPGADKSAVAAINRALRAAVAVHDTLGILLKFIIAVPR